MCTLCTYTRRYSGTMRGEIPCKSPEDLQSLNISHFKASFYKLQLRQGHAFRNYHTANHSILFSLNLLVPPRILQSTGVCKSPPCLYSGLLSTSRVFASFREYKLDWTVDLYFLLIGSLCDA